MASLCFRRNAAYQTWAVKGLGRHSHISNWVPMESGPGLFLGGTFTHRDRISVLCWDIDSVNLRGISHLGAINVYLTEPGAILAKIGTYHRHGSSNSFLESLEMMHTAVGFSVIATARVRSTKSSSSGLRPSVQPHFGPNTGNA